MSNFKRQIPPLCACGCGEKAGWHKRRKKWNTYICGHHTRSKNFFNKDREGPLCACGCGQSVKWNWNYKDWNKYISGHQNRGENFLKKIGKSPLCKCGCGSYVKWNKWNRRWNEYVHGHNWVGKNHSGETKEKLADFNIGHVVLEETRRKISIANSGENGPNWKGGLAAEPYCDVWLDKDLRRQSKNEMGIYAKIQIVGAIATIDHYIFIILIIIRKIVGRKI